MRTAIGHELIVPKPKPNGESIGAFLAPQLVKGNEVNIPQSVGG